MSSARKYKLLIPVCAKSSKNVEVMRGLLISAERVISEQFLNHAGLRDLRAIRTQSTVFGRTCEPLSFGTDIRADTVAYSTVYIPSVARI